MKLTDLIEERQSTFENDGQELTKEYVGNFIKDSITLAYEAGQKEGEKNILDKKMVGWETNIIQPDMSITKWRLVEEIPPPSTEDLSVKTDV